MEPLRAAVLMWEICHDPRFKACSANAQAALVFLMFATPGDGRRFWPKYQQWADATGTSPSSVKRAIAELGDAGILHVEPWLRPNGKQGASIYWLDGAYEYLAAENKEDRPRWPSPTEPGNAPATTEQGRPPASHHVPPLTPHLPRPNKADRR